MRPIMASSFATLSSKIHSILGLFLLYFAAQLNQVQTTCPGSYNCLRCNDSVPGREQCTSCPTPYYVLSTEFPQHCLPCGYKCRECQFGQPCQTCDTGYGPNYTTPNTGDCGACVPEPELCAGGCMRNGAGKCDSCIDGYRLERNNSACIPCPPLCRSCQSNSTTCDVCKLGFYFYPSNNTCGPCADNCKIVQCQNSGAGKCDRCDNGYGLTSTGTCAPCAQNCSAGCYKAGAFKCDKCDLGTGPTANGSCLPCAPNCNVTIGCNSSGTCIQCSNGYGLVTPSQTCGLTTTPNPTTATSTATSTMGVSPSSTATNRAAQSSTINSGSSRPAGGRVTTNGIKVTTSPGPVDEVTDEDRAVVAATLLALILGGMLIALIASLVWCCRFRPTVGGRQGVRHMVSKTTYKKVL